MQLVFEGKSDQCLPPAAGIDDLTMFSYTPSHWQTPESMQAFALHMDRALQRDGEPVQPWILLLDLASVHRRNLLALPEHVKLIYLPPGSTGYIQPLDSWLDHGSKA